MTDKKIRDDANNTKLGVVVKNLKAPDRRLILHAKHTGSWMTIKGTMVTGTVLCATELPIFFVHVTMLPP